jgi:hypothetical protein
VRVQRWTGSVYISNSSIWLVSTSCIDCNWERFYKEGSVNPIIRTTNVIIRHAYPRTCYIFSSGNGNRTRSSWVRPRYPTSDTKMSRLNCWTALHASDSAYLYRRGTDTYHRKHITWWLAFFVTSTRMRKLRALCLATVLAWTQRKHCSSTVGRLCVMGVAQQWIDKSHYIISTTTLSHRVPGLLS